MANYITAHKLGTKLYFAGYRPDGEPKFHPLKNHAVRYYDRTTAKLAAHKIGNFEHIRIVGLEADDEQ